jgi:hypothetical protein
MSLWYGISQDTEPPTPSTLLSQSLLPSLRLHLLPKSQLDVFLLVLESDGMEGVVSAGTTVAGAALAMVGGGVEMGGLVVGVSSVSLNVHVRYERSICCTWTHPFLRSLSLQAKVGSNLLLDPNSHESLLASSRITLSCMPALGVVTNVWQTGQVDSEEMMTVSTSFLCRPLRSDKEGLRRSRSYDPILACLLLQSLETLMGKAKDVHAVVAKSLIEGIEEKEKKDAAENAM